ncbi:hypothetical protein GCM10023317_09660 [Actinopolymorpha pittospori]|uniref:Uncharacterized protein n=1 Tax=Actinopolymorpha pittospori TaxID=648752 RepID=A0A927N1J6_9ACTN|nr:hypothetical protein [Actinopolymorpha pittospori]
MRSQPWSPLRIKGGVTVDDEEFKGWTEGQHRLDAWKLPLEQRPRFVWHCPGDVGHVLGLHR